MGFVLLLIAWLAIWAWSLEKERTLKERTLLINLLSVCLYRNEAQLREWRNAVDAHPYMKDDWAYNEAYEGSKADMQLQIDVMKEALRKIERDEAEAKAQGLLAEATEG